MSKLVFICAIFKKRRKGVSHAAGRPGQEQCDVHSNMPSVQNYKSLLPTRMPWSSKATIPTGTLWAENTRVSRLCSTVFLPAAQWSGATASADMFGEQAWLPARSSSAVRAEALEAPQPCCGGLVRSVSQRGGVEAAGRLTAPLSSLPLSLPWQIRAHIRLMGRFDWSLFVALMSRRVMDEARASAQSRARANSSSEPNVLAPPSLCMYTHTHTHTHTHTLGRPPV